MRLRSSTAWWRRCAKAITRIVPNIWKPIATNPGVVVLQRREERRCLESSPLDRRQTGRVRKRRSRATRPGNARRRASGDGPAGGSAGRVRKVFEGGSQPVQRSVRRRARCGTGASTGKGRRLLRATAEELRKPDTLSAPRACPCASFSSKQEHVFWKIEGTLSAANPGAKGTCGHSRRSVLLS